MTITLTPERQALAERARELREQDGLGYKTIARMLDVPTTTVRRWIKPGYHEHLLRLAREAKRRRKGTCQVCGKEVGYNGTKGKAISDLCARCHRQQQHDERPWTPETIIVAIQQWAAEHGHPPTAPDWWKEGGSDQHPSVNTVVTEMGWANAVQAAGFPRPSTGGYQRIGTRRGLGYRQRQALTLLDTHGACSPRQMRDVYGCTYASALSALQQLVVHGLARRVRRGVYELIPVSEVNDTIP